MSWLRPKRGRQVARNMSLNECQRSFLCTFCCLKVAAGKQPESKVKLHDAITTHGGPLLQEVFTHSFVKPFPVVDMSQLCVFFFSPFSSLHCSLQVAKKINDCSNPRIIWWTWMMHKAVQLRKEVFWASLRWREFSRKVWDEQVEFRGSSETCVRKHQRSTEKSLWWLGRRRQLIDLAVLCRYRDTLLFSQITVWGKENIFQEFVHRLHV